MRCRHSLFQGTWASFLGAKGYKWNAFLVALDSAHDRRLFKGACRDGSSTDGPKLATSACPLILSWVKTHVLHAFTCQPRNPRTKTRSFLKALRYLNFRSGFGFCSEAGRGPTGISVRQLLRLGTFRPRRWTLMWIGRYVSFGLKVFVGAASFPSEKPAKLRENCKFRSLSNRVSPACCWPRKRYATC